MKRMNVVFFANGDRVEAVRTPNGGVEVYKHGQRLAWLGNDTLTPMRCTDLDESLFRLGPEETIELLKFLTETE